MSKSGKLTAIVTGALLMSSCSSEVKEQIINSFDSEESKTELIKALSAEKGGKTITFEEAKEYVLLEKQVSELIKTSDMEELVEFYGEKEVKDRIINMVMEVKKDASNYMEDDGKTINEKELKQLIESTFSEYEYVDDIKSSQNALWGIVGGLSGILMMVMSERKEKKDKDK